MLPDNKLHFKKNIKAWLHQRGYLSQFLKASNFTPRTSISVHSKVVNQMNSKTGGDLYRVAIPEYKNALIVGVDMISMGGGRAAKVLSCVATRSQTLTQCYSKAYRLGEPSVDEAVDSLKYQTLKRKVIKDLKRSEARAEALCSFLREAISEYKKSTKGKNPEKIIIYRDGLGCLNEVNDRVITIEVEAVKSLLSTLS